MGPDRSRVAARTLLVNAEIDFALRIVVVLGLHGERLVGGLRLFEDLLAGRLLGLLHFLDFAFLVGAAVPEECAAHVGALLRLGGTVVAGEGDTARVLSA